jgi:RNA polymerase sigma factor (sigma-70 family)
LPIDEEVRGDGGSRRVSRVRCVLSDAQLVERCRGGDERAWAALVERFSRYVHAIAVGAYRLPDAEAEDVFQDVFSRAYEHLDRLRDDDAIRPWLGQLTRRLCVDRLRAARPAVELDEAAGEGAVDERLERIEQAVVVRDALAGISADCQEILDRFFARDESYRAIGAALDLPPGTIASRISRCLAKLRVQLEGRSDAA